MYTEGSSHERDIFTSLRSYRVSPTKIHCQPPPLVRVAYYASPYITRLLLLCQTRAR